VIPPMPRCHRRSARNAPISSCRLSAKPFFDQTGRLFMIKRIKPGKRFCGAVVVNGVVTTAGVTGEGADTVAQTRDILAQIDGLLAEAGTSKAKLISAAIWLRDIAHFNQMNEVWDQWVDKDNLPVRATVEARLAAPELLVEIQVTALV
jgi:enamine deaminase RidA (YjgF/YER057c/UK114 family)